MDRLTLRPGSTSWREAEATRLLDFGRGAARPGGGFGWLDDDGGIDTSEGRQLWITSRMTHVWSLAARQGIEGAAELAERGIRSLVDDHADREYGGWFAAVDEDGRPTDTTKAGYEHAFVLLSSSSATAAGVPGAAELFEQAQQIVLEHFWRDDEGRAVESWDHSFRTLELYRGANSNMHSVEAYLGAADVSGDEAWRQRALSIAERLIHEEARAHGWRVVEHHDDRWQPLMDYNADRPGDPFRPYGATPGHGLEWSRLLVDLHSSLADPPAWLVECAVALFDQAVGDGWRADGQPGFVYTTDWDGKPVTRTRMHWVMGEGVLAADALARCTGDERIAEVAQSWWQEIEQYFVDRQRGSWRHELTPDMTPSDTTWHGKPDVYHAYQACLLPSLPMTTVASVALSNGVTW